MGAEERVMLSSSGRDWGVVNVLEPAQIILS